MPWHFRDAILEQVRVPDGSEFVPEVVMGRAVEEYQGRIARDGPQPITVDFLSPSEDTIQGYVRRIHMVGSTVFLTGYLDDTAAGYRAQRFKDLVFGYAAMGATAENAAGKLYYTSIRILAISALDRALWPRG